MLGGALVVVVLLAVVVGGYQLMNSRTFQLAGRLVDRVDSAEKVVALTLDDGPTEHTTEILSVLAAEQIPATFYLTGGELDEHPEAGRAIAEAGHEIGNHTYHHRRMVAVSDRTVREEIERTDAEIAQTGYRGAVTFRPPYGKKLWALPKYLSDHNRVSVTWDVEPDSGTGAGTDQLVADTLAEVRPGSIILLHAMYASGAPSRAALAPIIRELHEAGYRFVTVSELLSHNRY
ncbi:polysaccharide deacetylase family protein [Nocardia callitridis]|uniref:Polysaccharide deacetylase family protein n=1 Tax=Nocardia callitridis TaxID=648753 RepID=A0ABP9K3L4_9NOCA